MKNNNISLLEYEYSKISFDEKELREFRFLNKLYFPNSDGEKGIFNLVSRNRIQATNYVGFVKTKNHSIQILPKIFGENQSEIIRNLMFLLSYTKKIKIKETDMNSLKAKNNIFEVFIYLFGKNLLEILKKDLFQNYKKEKIPLKSQMTELRITYDTGYLIYLLEKQFIQKEMWDKAMYCLIAIELVEPDHENIQKYKEIIEKHLSKQELSYKEFDEPKDYIILLDTNVILNKVLYDVGEYKISHNKLEEYNSLMEKWGNNNKFIISNSVKKELEKQIKFSIETVTDVCSKFKHFNKKEIITTLEKRFNNLITKYALKEENKEYNLENIEKFYSNYLGNLYEITLYKIENKKLSKKLKKLSDREGLLPEEGDLKLLADAIEMKKSNPNVAILSNDKDLYLFNEQIEKEFGIRIYR